MSPIFLFLERAVSNPHFFCSGDVGFGSNFACPGAQPSAIHATGLDDVKGCALAIAYQSDVNALKPEDFTVFSVNHTCVWYLNTEFEVPKLPACPEEGCHCAWLWIHSVCASIIHHRVQD